MPERRAAGSKSQQSIVETRQPLTGNIGLISEKRLAGLDGLGAESQPMNSRYPSNLSIVGRLNAFSPSGSSLSS